VLPGERIAHNSGTSPNQAKIARQAGIGPASGKGNSSKPAEKPAAAHNFHTLKDELCIQGRVYRIRVRVILKPILCQAGRINTLLHF
jgi:hypothetical protein